jgi:flagellar assembly protein FliH
MQAPLNLAARSAPEFESRSISNGEDSNEIAALAALTEAENKELAIQAERKKLEEQAQRVIDEHKADCERMKAEYEEQCKVILAKAEDDALKIMEDAADTAQLLRESAEKECVDLRKSAEKIGYSEGFAAGEKPGYDDGFAKGKAECAEALKGLLESVEQIPSEKERIFKEYENQLFDLIFTISNKVTAASLNQKDKSVISKMLKEAARSFRGSSYVKVSLSKLDVEESANVDLEELKRVFGTFGEKQQVEFEILKDAPKGTLILDNGSEISDAGIQTQLRMIENLGKGKFRDTVLDEEFRAKSEELKSKLKPDESPDEDESEE